MKTFLSLLTIATPIALILTPLSLEVAASLLFAFGLLGVALYDYTREKSAQVPAPVLWNAVRRHRERLGLSS
jgi:hypothetical protein